MKTHRSPTRPTTPTPPNIRRHKTKPARQLPNHPTHTPTYQPTNHPNHPNHQTKQANTNLTEGLEVPEGDGGLPVVDDAARDEEHELVELGVQVRGGLWMWGFGGGGGGVRKGRGCYCYYCRSVRLIGRLVYPCVSALYSTPTWWMVQASVRPRSARRRRRVMTCVRFHRVMYMFMLCRVDLQVDGIERRPTLMLVKLSRPEVGSSRRRSFGCRSVGVMNER